MSNILSALGFRRERGSALCGSMLELVKHATAVLPCDRGEYLITKSGGIELWFHNCDAELRRATGRVELVGITPFHDGQGLAEVIIADCCPDRASEPLDGAFAARIQASRSNAVPFMFEGLGYAFLAKELAPFECTGQLIGLAYGLQLHGGTAPGTRNPAALQQLVQPAIVPVEAASAQDAGDLVPAGSHSRSVVTGRVLKRQPLSNPWTGRLYWWMLVETDHATIDVFSDPEVHVGEIASGSFVAADCWLIGKLDRPAAKSLHQALPLPGSPVVPQKVKPELQMAADRGRD